MHPGSRQLLCQEGCSPSFLPSPFGAETGNAGRREDEKDDCFPVPHRHRRELGLSHPYPGGSIAPAPSSSPTTQPGSFTPAPTPAPLPQHWRSPAPDSQDGTGAAKLAAGLGHKPPCDSFQRQQGMQALVTNCRICASAKTNKPFAVFSFERMPFYREKKPTYRVFRNLILSIC